MGELTKEEKVLVEDVEKEVNKEKEAIDKAQKEIKEQNEKDGYVDNPGQKFSPEGMLESTIVRADKVIDKIINKITKVCDEENVKPQIGRRVLSQTQANPADANHPVVHFLGEEILVRFLIPPTDKYGNDGRVYITEEEAKIFKGEIDANKKS